MEVVFYLVILERGLPDRDLCWVVQAKNHDSMKSP